MRLRAADQAPDAEPLGQGRTDADGRIGDLAPPDGLTPQERHYHVPLLLSPYAFSTYRGS